MRPEPIELVCPSCRGPLVWSGQHSVCSSEDIEFGVRDGVPDLVLPSRRAGVDAFLEPYVAVRHREGWTDDDERILLGLPYSDLSGRHPAMWRTRARGLEALARLLTARYGARKLRICERGAGVAWLSYRLALDGHAVLATDVNTDPRDGLGAARHYVAAGAPMRVVAAEMDRLPLGDETLDVVVNAASLHYAVGRAAQSDAVAEGARVVVRGGLVVILDSPVYSTAEAGEAMVSEWRAQHPDALADSGFVVRGEILATMRELGLEPQLRTHWMGWGWTANYWRHRVLGPREPATLPLIVGVKL